MTALVTPKPTYVEKTFQLSLFATLRILYDFSG